MYFQKYPFGTYSGCLLMWKCVLGCLGVYMEIIDGQALFHSNCNSTCQISDSVMYKWLLYGIAPLISLLSGLYIWTCIFLCLSVVNPTRCFCTFRPACSQLQYWKSLTPFLTADLSILLNSSIKALWDWDLSDKGNWELKKQIKNNSHTYEQTE